MVAGIGISFGGNNIQRDERFSVKVVQYRYSCGATIFRVPTSSRKFWKVVDCFLENSTTWKVLEVEA